MQGQDFGTLEIEMWPLEKLIPYARNPRVIPESSISAVAGSLKEFGWRLPIRVGRMFQGGRKLGKTHQNVLVFCKGDWKKATEAIGPVECGDVEEAPHATGSP